MFVPAMRLLAACIVGLMIVGTSVASDERRVALVVGNAGYDGDLALANPVNDATDLAAALGRLGFDVLLRTDLDKPAMDAAFGEFAVAASGADVAVFYYAGHAMELNGRNYIMPIGAKLESEATVPYELARVDDVLDELRRASGVRVAILDACRDNPLASRLKAATARSRGGTPSRGLARIANTEGMLVAFATQAGATAADGQTRNSPFTAALLTHVATPGLEIGQMFRRVAKDVHDATDAGQLPELSISLLGEFYLNPGDADGPGPGAPRIAKAPVVDAPPAVAPDVAAFTQIASSNEAADFESFVRLFPDSPLRPAAEERLAALRPAEDQPLIRLELESDQPPMEPQVEAPSYCYVDDVRPPDDWLALRTKPGTRKGSQLRRLPSGTRLAMIGEREGDWYRVRTDDNLVGWVSWQVARWIRC